MSTAYFYLTPEGELLARKLAASHPGDLFRKDNFKDRLKEAFGRYDNLVCIMATGIVVRLLAPLIVHKTSDPAVIVLDQKGRFAISLLSGHLGGANDLAREMARISGGLPVITTATDVAGRLSFDTFAKEHHMAIENISVLKRISGTLLEGNPVDVYAPSSYPEFDREDLLRYHRTARETYEPETPLTPERPSVIIDERIFPSVRAETDIPVLKLRPRTICAGIGCKRGMAGKPIIEALLQTLEEEGISPLSLKCLATIPLKADEPGIIEAAEYFHVPLVIIPPEDIKNLDIDSLGIATSDFVAANTGVLSVSTASAYLASGRGKILRDKAKYKGITVALAMECP